MDRKEEKRRQQLGNAMAESIVMEYTTPKGTECHLTLSPILITDDNTEFRIDIHTYYTSDKVSGQSFDLNMARAYHALLGKAIAMIDAGEVKNPWETSDG